MKKSTQTQEAEQAIKARKNSNKNKPSKWATVLTVAITLVSLATVGGIFYAGSLYGQNKEHDMNMRVQSEVQAATAKQATVASLK
jgi:cell division protein FtsX